MQDQTRSQIDFADLFDQIHTVAVVGYSDKKERAGHYVPQYMASKGYQVIAVNPKFGDHVDGFRCYASLSDIPADIPIDVVNVFRSPEFVPPLVEEAAKMQPKPRYFWMQPGAENEAAAEAARAAGMTPIMEECMLARHKNLPLR